MDCLTYCFCVIFVALLWLWLSIYFYLPLVSSEAACIAKQCPQGCRLKPSGEAECFCSLGYRMRPDSSCEGTSILKLYYIFIEFCISAMSIICYNFYWYCDMFLKQYLFTILILYVYVTRFYYRIYPVDKCLIDLVNASHDLIIIEFIAILSFHWYCEMVIL